LAEVKEWVMGKGLKRIILEEPSMNPIEALVDRLKEQVNSVVTEIAAAIKFVTKLLTEKTLPKNVAKVSNNYLFVFLYCKT